VGHVSRHDKCSLDVAVERRDASGNRRAHT
jgi:hypothetical protein